MDAKRQMPPIVEDGTYDLVTHTRTNARSRTLEHTDARTDSHIQTDTHARTHTLHTYFSNLAFTENMVLF